MKIKKLASVVALAIVASGCSTKAYFKLPEQAKVSVYERPQQYSQGLVKTKPFYWTAAGGIPYKLSDENGTLIRQGKLRARFRVASIFWPPFAIIYWPMGFGQRCYDLTAEQPQTCTHQDLIDLRRDHRLSR
ncbi:hypothetical protein [Pseudomonas indica]|uniref:Outer membrane lipoprotein n=1 Tax=Pseudomonas indica TaxID=137658 RepID=A0A1G9PMD0_9PSED|nr:hypothetical protein [Pseudomonas indica]MBU3059618.1 hypothetical protein [Pseudomonas indica]SDL99377.1 hypothetical protein SAMN05216186_13919 [Pseudomonas indica]